MVKRLSIVAFATVSFFGIAQNRNVDGQNEIPVNTGIVTASLNPGNGYVENNHATGKMSNALITENAPQLSPTATCDWTVNVYNPTGSGSGVTWTLKNSSGTTLLSGGPYGSGYNDVKTVTAEGPLTFQITNGIIESPYYKINNGTMDVAKGVLSSTAGTKTITDLQCGGTPPTPEPANCAIVYPGESMVNGMPTNSEIIANDFEVTSGTFNANQVTFRMIGAISTATLTFYENNAGNPGTLFKTYTNLTPTSQTAVNGDYYDVTFDLGEDIPLTNGIYWLGIKTAALSFWSMGDQVTNATERYSSDNGATWTQMAARGYDGTFTVRDKNCTPVSGGCDWTVNVYGLVSGSDVAWTLKDSGGTTLLSGGPYASSGGYNDVKTVTAEGPLTFNISSNAFNAAYYKINNGTIDAAKGVVTGTPKTITDLECGGTPPPDPAPCQIAYSGSMFPGIGLISTMMANDFLVPAGESININQILVKISGSEVTSATINFYEDDAGKPGALIQSFGPIAPTSLTPLGYDTGGYYLYYDAVFDLPSSITIGEGIHWLGIKTSDVTTFWEVADEISNNTLGYFLNSNNTWSPNNFGFDCAFTVKDTVCNLAVSDLGKSSDLAYPNPVKDVLYLQTKAEIANVEVFNLVGQRVMKNTKISNGQINVKSLATGTYVFRINLKDGQVETFKVIKE